MKNKIKILSIAMVLLTLSGCNSNTSSTSSVASISSTPTTSVSSSSDKESTSSKTDDSTSLISSEDSSTTPSEDSSSSDEETNVEIKSEVIASDLASYDITNNDYVVGDTITLTKGLTYDSGSGKDITTIDGETKKSGGRIKNVKSDKPLKVKISGSDVKFEMWIAPSGPSDRSLIIKREGEDTNLFEKANEGSSSMFELNNEDLGFDLTEGTYLIYGTNGYNLYYLGIKQTLSDIGTETGFEVDSSMLDKDYLVGETIDTSKIVVYATYSSGAKIALDSSKYTINTSTINSSAAGTYNISVSYGAYAAQTIEAIYHAKTNMEVYTDFTFNNKEALRFPKIYAIGATISTNNIVVRVGDDKFTKVITNSELTFSSVDTSTAGEKTLTVTYGSLSEDIKLTVVDKSLLKGETDTETGETTYYFQVIGSDGMANNSFTEGQVVTGSTTMAFFSTIQNALDYITACSIPSTDLKVITLASEKTFKEKLYVEEDNVCIYGTETEEAKKPIIEYDALADTQDAKGNLASTYGSSTVTVHGNNFQSAGVIYKNTAFTTMDEYNSSKAGNKQACAIVVDQDAVFSDCTFVGFQDTLYARSGNQEYIRCKISGMTDYIFGEDSNVYLSECEITSIYRNSDTNGGYICVTKEGKGNDNMVGFFFDNCTIKGDNNVVEGTVSLARPWGKNAQITYANCTMDKAISKKAYGDTSDKKNPRFDQMSGNSPVNAQFAEYNNTGDGAITTAVAGGSILTETEYEALKEQVNKIFNL